MIIIVAAMTRKHVIAKDGKLPWHIEEEAAHYRDIIRGKTIIMGRVTFGQMKHPFAGGHDIVVTRSDLKAEGADVCSSIEEALEKATEYGDDAYVVGGKTLYEQTISIADRMLISYIKKDYDGDTFFPEFGAGDWIVDGTEEFNEFEYVEYSRKK